MAKGREDALKVVHNVKLCPMGNCIYIEWNGFDGRHDYMMAKDIDDLDRLLTEIIQAMLNYKIKRFTINKKGKK